MLFWQVLLIVVILATGAAFLYLGNRVEKFPLIQKISYHGTKVKINAGYLIVSLLFGILWATINLMNAVVCLFYFAMFWLICDFIFICVKRFLPNGKVYYAGLFAVVISLFALGLGWYQNHHIWQTNYTVLTEKNVPELKIAFFADSHIGSTFDGNKFAEHVARINDTKPDAVFIVGDYVDDGTSRENMIISTRSLKNITAPFGVYFVMGNHDKGYYGAAYRGFSASELVAELRKNNVTILQDEAVSLKEHFHIIGRKDKSETQRGTGRLSMKELTKTLDESKFSIVLDHQPNDYTAQRESGVDLVLSGHTHGGQLWPFNKVGEWLKANDKTYGYEKREKTNFIVTSGLSDWTIKFKTGTKSEFVIVNIKKGF